MAQRNSLDVSFIERGAVKGLHNSNFFYLELRVLPLTGMPWFRESGTSV